MANKKSKLKNKEPGASFLWVELLFFAAIGLFSFSLITYTMASSGEGFSITLNPLTERGVSEPQREVIVSVLYEAESNRPIVQPTLSPIFTPSVLYWEDNILRWSSEWNLDPNLIATVMQIESCGYPRALSRSGAMSLFQVMPFHFTAGEDPYDPDTNARRGMAYLSRGLEISNGHAGLAMAGYNGGHSVITKPSNLWADETRRYYRWGSGIYREASAGWESSPTLDAWRGAGGGLCSTAENYLGI